MNDRFHPYDTCLRQPVWPDSDPRGQEQMIPTGTPEEGCPIGSRNSSTGEWEPFRKRQKDHPYQVVRDISGKLMAYMEEWGSLEVGDPNRLGMYRLLVPDPTGLGSFADGVGPDGPVRGWNGSVLCSIYPAIKGAEGGGLETAAQTVPAHLMGRVPQWDGATVDRSVGLDEQGKPVRLPDTFEGFHWLRRGYAVLYALPPRGYLMLFTEFAEKTVMAAVRKLDQRYPFAAAPANASKHSRRYRFLTGSSAGGPPVLAVMESAGLSDFFDGGYSSGPISPALNYFGAYDGLWVSRAVDALGSRLGEERTRAEARGALLGLRSHKAGLGDLKHVPAPGSDRGGLMTLLDSFSPWHGSGGHPYGNEGIQFGKELLGKYAAAFAGKHDFRHEDIAAINDKITELMGGQRQVADPGQFVKFSQHHIDTGRVWKPFVLVYGLSDGPHTPLLGRVLFDMAQRAESNEAFPAGFFTDNLISLNGLEQANRGGEEHWSPTVLAGLMNLVVDLLEAKVMERRGMPDYLESNYGVHPDTRNRYFFEPGLSEDMDHHEEGDGAPRPGVGDYRRTLIPFAVGRGGATNLSGARFENRLEYVEEELVYRGQTHDGRGVEWPDNLLPREMAGRSVDDLY